LQEHVAELKFGRFILFSFLLSRIVLMGIQVATWIFVEKKVELKLGYALLSLAFLVVKNLGFSQPSMPTFGDKS
jgi:hypothetical protein